MLKNLKRTKNDKKIISEKIRNLGRTFCTKLFIKLTSNISIPDLYLYILKFEFANRTKEDIEKVINKLKALFNLNEYLKYQEEEKSDNYNNIIKELSKISFHLKKKKLSILKKTYSDFYNFYFILNGSISKLNLIFKKEKISYEEYLVYIFKLEFLNEKQILDKCNLLNKSVINIDIEKLNDFFEQHKEYNYDLLKSRAKKELINEGFIFYKKNNNFEISSINSYLNIGKFKLNERNDINTSARFFIYVGQYIKIKTLIKGDIIGDLNYNENSEGNVYICETNCDLAFVNKSETKKSMMNKYIINKYQKIFRNDLTNFFIFKDLLNKSDIFFEKNIYPNLIYKKYTKGEKIIVQNSQYEGIFFILDGKINISISQSFNELSNTLMSLQYSIFKFQDYASKIIKSVDILNEFYLKYIVNKKKNKIINLGKNNKINSDILVSNEYLDNFKGIKNITFYNMTSGDILGMNELFDYKTELYNFSATCISEETHLFFLSKKNFNNIVLQNLSIMNNVIQLIDLKAKTLIGQINNFRMNYSEQILNKIKIKRNKLMTKNLSKNNSEIKLIENSKNNSFYKSSDKKIKKNTNNRCRNKKINVNLFKNNTLLTYLKNENLVRNNSLSDLFNININEVLNKKNIRFLSPQSVRNSNNKNFIKYKSNHLGDGFNLLKGVYTNQKKFDEFQRVSIFFNRDNINNFGLLPKIKNKRNKKLIDDVKKKFGKTMSLLDIRRNKFKVPDS